MCLLSCLYRCGVFIQIIVKLCTFCLFCFVFILLVLNHLSCAYSLRRSVFFRSSQKPEPNQELSSPGKRVRFSEEPPRVFPSPELNPKQGPRPAAPYNDNNDDISQAPQLRRRRGAVVQRLLEWNDSSPEVVDGLTAKPRLSSEKPRAKSVGCVPWRRLFRRGKKGRADEHPVAVETTGAPRPQQPTEELETWIPQLQHETGVPQPQHPTEEHETRAPQLQQQTGSLQTQQPTDEQETGAQKSQQPVEEQYTEAPQPQQPTTVGNTVAPLFILALQECKHIYPLVMVRLT